MHISEGILSGPVLFSGIAAAAAGTAIGLKKLDYHKIAGAGMLSSAFFVASLIHVPVPPSNAHLILNGLVGLLLGWGAFPVILVALSLQAVFFQFGGITVLGVNTVIMAFPAVVCGYLFRNLIWKPSFISSVSAFAVGFLSVFLSGLILALFLISAEENFFNVAVLFVAAHAPIMIIEGLITAFCVSFLKKVRPEMLPGHNR